MSKNQPRADAARDALDRLVAELRPKLHRYCARMTGSVIEGEDVVQQALLKAVEAAQGIDSIDHPEAWLFRIAHNAAVDFLRRQVRQSAQLENLPDEALAMIPDPTDTMTQRQAVAAGLRLFMGLPTVERSSVIGFERQQIATIRDYRYATYVADEAEIIPIA